jgi:hypothetical protein
MKNIHILPTEKPSRLIGSRVNLSLKEIPILGFDAFKTQHIYITNDEEIKEGEYCITKTNEVIKFKKSYTQGFLYKKIILTTDQDLIKDGVQAIDDKFLEWFVKNPNCENVKVESFCKHGDNCPSKGAYDKQYLCDVGYKIIIPKEEPKIKEYTLSDLCEKLMFKQCDLKLKNFTVEFTKYRHEGTGNNIENYKITYKNNHIGYICIEDRVETKGDYIFLIFDLHSYKVYPYVWGSFKFPENVDLLLKLNSLLK